MHPEDTADRNVLLARFLDEPFCLAVLKLTKAERMAELLERHNAIEADNWKELAKTADENLRRTMNARYDAGKTQLSKEAWDVQHHRDIVQRQTEREAIEIGQTKSRLNSKAFISASAEFEPDRGIDMSITFWSASNTQHSDIGGGDIVAVTVRPTIGNDFPSILREMNELDTPFILVANSYSSDGPSEAQMKAMFARSRIKVVMVKEIEAAL